LVIGVSRQLRDATKTYARNRASFGAGAERIQNKGADVAEDPGIFACPSRPQQLALTQSRATGEEIPLGAG